MNTELKDTLAALADMHTQSHVCGYTLKGESREEELEFMSLDQAVGFADGVIEDGGSAFITTTDAAEAKRIGPRALCDIYVE